MPSRASSSRRSGGVAAGIDHRALGRAALAPDDVAVRLQRAELVSVDRERHRGESSGSLVSAQAGAGRCRSCVTGGSPRSRRRTVRGRPSCCTRRTAPSGPCSSSCGRETALGEHSVKESALLLVLDGTVRVEAGDESVDAETPGRSSTSTRTSGTPSRATAAPGCCCCSRRGRAKGTTAATGPSSRASALLSRAARCPAARRVAASGCTRSGRSCT